MFTISFQRRAASPGTSKETLRSTGGWVEDNRGEKKQNMARMRELIAPLNEPIVSFVCGSKFELVAEFRRILVYDPVKPFSITRQKLFPVIRLS